MMLVWGPMVYAAIVEGRKIERRDASDNGTTDVLPSDATWDAYSHVTALLSWLREVARGWSVTLLVQIAVATIRSTWRATRAHVRQLSNVHCSLQAHACTMRKGCAHSTIAIPDSDRATLTWKGRNYDHLMMQRCVA